MYCMKYNRYKTPIKLMTDKKVINERTLTHAGCQVRIASDLKEAQIHMQIIKGPIVLDCLAMQAFLNGEEMKLAQKEFALLLFFVQNEGVDVISSKLFEKVWRQPMLESNNALKNAISRLRKKLIDSEYQIVAVRCLGYRFEKVE